MNFRFLLIFLSLYSCVYYIKIKTPSPSLKRKYPPYKFNVIVNKAGKEIISDYRFETPIENQIRKSFISYFEKLGLKYDSSSFDYFFEINIDTFNIYLNLPPELKRDTEIIAILKGTGACLFDFGIPLLIGGSLGNMQTCAQIGWVMFVAGSILYVPSLYISLAYKLQKVNFIGILEAEVILNDDNRIKLKKNYHIRLFEEKN